MNEGAQRVPREESSEVAGNGPGRPLASGYVPLHQQVYAALSSDLTTGRWAPGDRLPTERELAADFGCSLITVRRALEKLVRERRIVRIRGKGTFATSQPVDRELASLSSFTDEMNARGLDPRTTVTDVRLEEALPATAEAFVLRVGTAVYAIERVRLAGGEPLMVEQVRLPAHLFPGLLEHDLAHASLYELLVGQYGVVLERGDETIEPALPEPRIAELLGQDAHSPVLVLTLVSYSVDGRPVEFCRSIVRGDRARYHLEVRRGGHLRVLHDQNRNPRG